jgi:hypothetical protein
MGFQYDAAFADGNSSRLWGKATGTLRPFGIFGKFWKVLENFGKF